jgi:isoquinoline 1-oxidoreductase subunit beta
MSTLDRRAFLSGLGWTAAGVTLVSCRLLPPLPVLRPTSTSEAVSWLQVTGDGAIHFRAPVQELGQGAILGLTQIVAEELGVAPDQIIATLPETAGRRPLQGTFGSYSIERNARPIAEAAAILREVLRERAAARAQVPIASLRDAEGGFLGSTGFLSYAQIAAGAPVLVEQAHRPPVATRTFEGPRANRRWVGADVPAVELHAIVTGQIAFAQDATLPDLAFGRVVPPPVPGAKLVSASLTRARQVSGFVAGVVDLGRGVVGVVAETWFQLPAVVAAIEAEWRRPPPFDSADVARALDVDTRLARGALEISIAEDQVGTAPWDVDLRLDTPFAAHAPIELRAGVARWTGELCELWVGTQDAFFLRDTAARSLDVPGERVIVHSQRMGGGFGGRAGFEAIEAAILARAAKRPVKVQWTRPDDFHRGHHGPPTSHRIRARLDGEGRIAAWWHALVSGHVLLNPLALPTWLQAATGFLVDKGVTRGLVPPYAVGRRRIEATAVRLPIATGAWRGLGAAPNTFAIEAAIDALALQAGADPFAFRLRHLSPTSAIAQCLARVGVLASWRGPGRLGLGRAVASGLYHDTAVAAIAEVEVVGEVPRLRHVFCVHDCGDVINPDRVRSMIEGNIVWALGYALMHELQVQQGRITADYLTAYPLPTIADTPTMTIELLGADRLVPKHLRPVNGAGEAAVTAATAAIAAAARQALGTTAFALPVPGSAR